MGWKVLYSISILKNIMTIDDSDEFSLEIIEDTLDEGTLDSVVGVMGDIFEGKETVMELSEGIKVFFEPVEGTFEVVRVGIVDVGGFAYLKVSREFLYTFIRYARGISELDLSDVDRVIRSMVEYMEGDKFIMDICAVHEIDIRESLHESEEYFLVWNGIVIQFKMDDSGDNCTVIFGMQEFGVSLKLEDLSKLLAFMVRFETVVMGFLWSTISEEEDRRKWFKMIMGKMLNRFVWMLDQYDVSFDIIKGFVVYVEQVGKGVMDKCKAMESNDSKGIFWDDFLNDKDPQMDRLEAKLRGE